MRHPCAVGAAEVARRKCLQRWRTHAWCFCPAARQVIAQLCHQHRRRLLGMVGGAPALPTDVQALPSGKQRLQKQVAVILTTRAVARTALFGQAHEVEVARGLAARIVAIVHAQQAHHLEGNGAHGHEGGELNASAQKALLQARRLQVCQPLFTHHRQGQGLGQSRCLAMLHPLLQGLQGTLQPTRIAVVGGLEEALQHALQHAQPIGGGMGDGQHLQAVLHGGEPIAERPQQPRFQAAYMRIGHAMHTLPSGGGRRLSAHGVIQQQPAQALGPGVLLALCHVCRHAPLQAVLGVQTPAHAGTLQPVLQHIDIGRHQVKSGLHGLDFQQRQPIAEREA